MQTPIGAVAKAHDHRRCSMHHADAAVLGTAAHPATRSTIVEEHAGEVVVELRSTRPAWRAVDGAESTRVRNLVRRSGSSWST